MRATSDGNAAEQIGSDGEERFEHSDWITRVDRLRPAPAAATGGEQGLEGLKQPAFELAQPGRGDTFPPGELGHRQAEPGAVVALDDRCAEERQQRAWLESGAGRYWSERHGLES